MTAQKRSGFSLIEILIVIAIMAILAAIGTYSYKSTQGKTRDAQRKADLATLASILERYYADHGFYPDSFFSTYPMIVYPQGRTFTSVSTSDQWIPELDSYTDRLPKDPRQTAFLPSWLAKLFKPITFPPQTSADDVQDCDPRPQEQPEKNLPDAADFNNDGVVDSRDAAMTVMHWDTFCYDDPPGKPGPYGKPYDLTYDINPNRINNLYTGDGTISILDTFVTSINFGRLPNKSVPEFLYLYQTPVKIPDKCDPANDWSGCLDISRPHRSYILWAKLENKNDPDIWTNSQAKCGIANQRQPDPKDIFSGTFNTTGYCLTSPQAVNY